MSINCCWSFCLWGFSSASLFQVDQCTSNRILLRKSHKPKSIHFTPYTSFIIHSKSAIKHSKQCGWIFRTKDHKAFTESAWKHYWTQKFTQTLPVHVTAFVQPRSCLNNILLHLQTFLRLTTKTLSVKIKSSLIGVLKKKWQNWMIPKQWMENICNPHSNNP